MSNKVFKLVSILFFGCISAFANQVAIVDCKQGGQVVVTQGLTSTTKVFQSFPSCQIDVFNHGTVTHSTIYSDNNNTVLANPFTAQNLPYYGAGFFYAANGHYDITISGGGILTPITFSDIILNDFAQATFGVCNVTFSATPTFNLSICNIFKITLTSNITSSSISFPNTGQPIILQLTQDAIGGRTFVCPTGFIVCPKITSAPNSTSSLYAYSDGISYYVLNNGTFTGIVTAPNLNGTLQVGTAPGQYATLESCYAALVVGQTCEVMPNFTEALSADLVFSLNDAGFLFKGSATITLGSFRFVFNPGITAPFLVGQSTAGGPAASSNAVKFIYTGTGAAFAVGSAVSNSAVNYALFRNIWIDISGAGSSAIGIQGFAFSHARLDSVFINGKNVANTQICFQIDDGAGGAFSGGIKSDHLLINNCQTAVQLKGSTVESTFDGNIFLSSGFAGGKGIDLNGADVASNVFVGGTISGYTTAVSLAGASSHNVIIVETDAATTDVACSGTANRNHVTRMDSTGAAIVVSCGALTTNIVDNPGGKIFFGIPDFSASGFTVNALAPIGNVLRGNGISFVPAQLVLNSIDFANQGTTTTVLHGNAAGNPSFGAVSLTADVSGLLPGTNGGTGVSSTAVFPTTGTINTGTGTNNTIPKFTTGATGIIGNSSISDDGSTITLAERIGSYGGVTLAGNGMPAIAGYLRAVSQVAAITATNLIASTISSNTLYLIEGEVDCDTSSAAATAVITIAWTDVSNTAQTSNSGTATCTGLGANSRAQVFLAIQVKASTAITAAVAIVNTPTYDVRISARQMGTN